MLDEPRAQVDVKLHEWTFRAGEAVHLARLDHQDVPRSSLELLPVDRPDPLPLLDELNFIVRMEVRLWTGAGHAVEQEDGDVHIALISPDEVVRAPSEWQCASLNSQHGVRVGVREDGVRPGSDQGQTRVRVESDPSCVRDAPRLSFSRLRFRVRTHTRATRASGGAT